MEGKEEMLKYEMIEEAQRLEEIIELNYRGEYGFISAAMKNIEYMKRGL